MRSSYKILLAYARAATSDTTRQHHRIEHDTLHGLGDVMVVDFRDERMFAEAIRSADAVVTSWGVRFDREAIATMSRCRIIAMAAVGVDMVDLDAATASGIVVTNAPDTFIEEVADHTMMLLLAAARRTTQVHTLAANGKWGEGRGLLMGAPRLRGQTLGLLGYGNVARATARRAQPFGLRMIAHDPYLPDTVLCADSVDPVPFDELLRNSDYLSLHTPLNDETRHLINAEALHAMRPSAYLINTARGPVVDEAALIDALHAGRIAGAALDVLEAEPPNADNPLLTHPNVLVTPHVASASTRMLPECRRRAATQVALVLQGKWPMSCVNPKVLESTDLLRWQPTPSERGPNR
ncbi:MAG: C-terminal binding protein [Gammaproteobacteria bacterium]|nr:C-terminal binding protein [Gammaproteobacteria bacterium]